MTTKAEAIKLVRYFLTETCKDEHCSYNVMFAAMLQFPDDELSNAVSYYLGWCDASFELTKDGSFRAIGELFTMMLSVLNLNEESIASFKVVSKGFLDGLKKMPPPLKETEESLGRGVVEVIVSKRNRGGNPNSN